MEPWRERQLTWFKRLYRVKSRNRSCVLRAVYIMGISSDRIIVLGMLIPPSGTNPPERLAEAAAVTAAVTVTAGDALQPATLPFPSTPVGAAAEAAANLPCSD